MPGKIYCVVFSICTSTTRQTDEVSVQQAQLIRALTAVKLDIINPFCRQAKGVIITVSPKIIRQDILPAASLSLKEHFLITVANVILIAKVFQLTLCLQNGKQNT